MQIYDRPESFPAVSLPLDIVREIYNWTLFQFECLNTSTDTTRCLCQLVGLPEDTATIDRDTWVPKQLQAVTWGSMS